VSPQRELQPRGERSAAPGVVQVWRDADRFWRYRYVHSPRQRVIGSNRSFLTKDQAVESARIAYPGVPVVELTPPPGGESGRRPWLLRAAVKLTGLGLLLMVVRKLLRFVLGMRRSVRKARVIAGWAGLAAALASRDRPSGQDASR
jgi:hypothetical protein